MFFLNIRQETVLHNGLLYKLGDIYDGDAVSASFCCNN